MALEEQNAKQLAWDAWYQSSVLTLRASLKNATFEPNQEQQREIGAAFEKWFSTRGLDLIKRLCR